MDDQVQNESVATGSNPVNEGDMMELTTVKMPRSDETIGCNPGAMHYSEDMSGAVGGEIGAVGGTDVVDGIAVGRTCSPVPSILCLTVRDKSASAGVPGKVTMTLNPLSTVGEVVQEVARRCKYEADSFSLVMQRTDIPETELEKLEQDKTLAEAGFDMEGIQRVNLTLLNLNGVPPRRTDEDDLSLGASASPTFTSSEKKWFEMPETYSSAANRHDTGYVGLVNQAMTCYLNSLLQTLFMTPEFRNALYRWEYKGGEEAAAKNIPCQLQRLFLQLQTTNRSAVETTSLTRSFGWDSSEAWQQHDVQELCRVMFDALEQCFKNTDQSNLISDLYEGKIKDYVKCLGCSNERAREDTFLDIPLPIRPFGSLTAYKSVEEALKAFVSHEVLTDQNRYQCDKCNALCDAHKGLKFARFPYLLTIHLLRFDFDYETLHRIKLNDMVTFPNILDLNSLLESPATKETLPNTSVLTPDKPSVDKVDDGSTADSALDGEELSVGNASSSHHESDSQDQDEDEGIDVGSSYNNEKNKLCLNTGPYVYELFSIMIHSGSATGGHYYAYVKDFTTGEWFCFNDQTVSRITYDDIRKSYGGGTRGYYSSWNSSSNAYMLMYRQIDKARNTDSFVKDEFPQHIKDLMLRMEREEATEREAREAERSLCRIKLFCQHPRLGKMMEQKLKVNKDMTLLETTTLAYKELELESVVPLERCRLVRYEEFHDSLECSFEGQEQETIAQVLGGVKSAYKFDLLMEIRDQDKEFEVYRDGGTTVKVFVVNLETEEIEGPHTVRGNLSMTVREFKEYLGSRLNLNPDTMRIVLEKYYSELKPLSSDDKVLKMEGFFRSNKVYVEASGIEANNFFVGSLLYGVLDRFENTITICCPIPDTSKEALEKLQIPPYRREGTTAETENEHLEEVVTATTVPLCPVGEMEAEGPSCKEIPISSCNGATRSSCDKDLICENELTDPTCMCPLVNQPEAAEPHAAPPKVGSSPLSLPTYLNLLASPSPVPADPSLSRVSCNGSDGEDEGIADGDSAMGSSYVNSDQSASEDSSLTSDSDRTLVGEEEPADDEDRLSNASNSPDYRNVSSPEDNNQDSKETEVTPGWGDEEERILSTRRYFRAEYFVEDGTQTKMLRMHVDKRITVGRLKEEMQTWLGVSHEHFKLYRSYSNGAQEFECSRMTETLNTYPDNCRLNLKLGRALMPGEHRGKIYLLEPNNNSDPSRFLIDWVICRGEKVGEVREAITREVNSRCMMNLVLESVRLRKKSWKNPQAILMDWQKFEEDVPLYPSWELYLQVLSENEAKMEKQDGYLGLFVKRWRPSSFTVDPMTEIILHDTSAQVLKEKLSEMSGIEVQNIEFAKGNKGGFPWDLSVLEIQNDIDWTQRNVNLDQWPLYITDDGSVVYYRDKTEPLKEFSDEERRELTASENRRLHRDLQYSCPSSSSSASYTNKSREKGLKIYLDHTEQ